MSTEAESPKRPESELGLDLDLHFLPSWAQKAPTVNQYEKYSGDEGDDRRGRRDRGPRDGGGPRRFDRPRRPEGAGGPGQGGPRPFRRDGAPGGPSGSRGPGGGGFGNRDRGPRRFDRPRPVEDRPQIKLPDLEVTFFPEEKGVESLARQIKMTGRAYPLFEIAYLVLKKPERYHIQLVAKKPEKSEKSGQPEEGKESAPAPVSAQAMFICGLDDTLWLDENEAMHHVLDKHFATFYSSEKIPTDAPKGVYTFVAQCGMSGVILGPPNYHDYQNKLRKLHQERFSRMPFDAFKSRIKIVKDEAVVKKWLDEQSFRTEYTCLNIPETIKLNSREEVENHFRETHLANVIKPATSHTLAGSAVAGIQNRGLQALLRRAYDDQMRFPIKVVNILSGQFARQGLQFFKVNKSVTHVALARPHFLDLEASPVSDGVRQVVEFINSHPRTTRKKLVDALAPEPPATEAPAPAPAPSPAAEGQPAPADGTALPEPAPPPPVANSAAVSALIGNLHWLLHQGHVLEFANGILETAKKPLPRPPKPERKSKPAAGAAAAVYAPEAAETSEASEAEVTTPEGVMDSPGAEAEAASAPVDSEPPSESPGERPAP